MNRIMNVIDYVKHIQTSETFNFYCDDLTFAM